MCTKFVVMKNTQCFSRQFLKSAQTLYTSKMSSADEEDTAFFKKSKRKRHAMLCWYYQQRRHRLLLRSRIPRRAYLSQAGSWEELHSHYSDTEFKQYYRVSRNQFNKLLQLILARFPSYQGNRRKGALDVRLKLGSGLRFLAGGMYLDIMRSHFQRKTTFYDHLNETLVVIQRCISIKFPTDSAELAKVEEECCLPGEGGGLYRGAVGFIDGIVVKMTQPDIEDARAANVKDWYVARKHSYGINLQCICDGKLRFTYISLAFSASSHDSICWNASDLATKFVNGGLQRPYFLCGDSAYSACPCIITPFKTAPHNTMEDIFNFVHSSKRAKIECAFGILCRRFGVLWRPLEGPMLRRCDILNAVFRLHNFIIDNPDSSVSSNEPLSSCGNVIGVQPVTDEQVREEYLLRTSDCISTGTSHSTRSGAQSRQYRQNIAEALCGGGILRD